MSDVNHWVKLFYTHSAVSASPPPFSHSPADNVGVPCIFFNFGLSNKIPLREAEPSLHMVSGLGHIESEWERQCWFTLLRSAAVGQWEAIQTGHWRGWGSIRKQHRLMWESQVRCVEKRLLLGNSRQEALWNVRRLYAAQKPAAAAFTSRWTPRRLVSDLWKWWWRPNIIIWCWSELW